jgi:hypothetical protein
LQTLIKARRSGKGKGRLKMDGLKVDGLKMDGRLKIQEKKKTFLIPSIYEGDWKDGWVNESRSNKKEYFFLLG